MRIRHFIIFITCLALVGACRAEDMDKELQTLADKLAASIKEHGNKKVTVIDFTDLQGSTEGELGKYIAEQLTIDLVMNKRDFSVLDRANLKKILAEHKLTATGLVDPENAKKLGMFAGVDAMILGTILPKGQNINLTVKIITTETAEIVGAARAEFAVDETVKQLVAKPPASSTTTSGGGGFTEGPKVTKTFGDLRVELDPVQIANGRQFVATFLLKNQNPRRSVSVALGTLGNNMLKAVLTDSDGFEFYATESSVMGVACASIQQNQEHTIWNATEIKPNDSVTATVKFTSHDGRSAGPGTCSLRMEFILSRDFNGNYGSGTAYNWTTKVDAQ